MIVCMIDCVNYEGGKQAAIYIVDIKSEEKSKVPIIWCSWK